MHARLSVNYQEYEQWRTPRGGECRRDVRT